MLPLMKVLTHSRTVMPLAVDMLTSSNNMCLGPKRVVISDDKLTILTRSLLDDCDAVVNRSGMRLDARRYGDR